MKCKNCGRKFMIPSMYSRCPECKTPLTDNNIEKDDDLE